MSEVGVGGEIYGLRTQIQKITGDLNYLEKASKNIPELISSTNLLRLNDHLNLVDNKKSELISAYEQYSKQLELMLTTVFDIQKELKEILKTQSSLISKNQTKKKSRNKPKRSQK